MKKSIVIYALIVLLACALTGTITYILVNNKEEQNEIKENKPNNNEEQDNKENENQEVKQDGVKLLKTYNLNDKIVEEFEITLNGKTKNIKTTFFTQEAIENGLYSITGSLKEIDVYYEEDFNNKDRKFTIEKIRNTFNEKNFQIIKGKDSKSYLLIKSGSANDDYEEENELLVLNDNFKLLSGNIREDDIAGRTGFNITYFYNNICEVEKDIWYENTFNTKIEGRIHIKIEDNKIYFLAPIIKENGTEGDFGILEERVYTLNNNKLEYEVINTYKIKQVCQQL